MRAYHFTGQTLRNGEPIPHVGEWLEHDGPVIPCDSGLHASEHPMDALEYAPGPILHLVELEGDLVSHGDPADKWVGRRRKILATIDATELLKEFARWCALQVIHLWDAPDIVRRYLETGDESLSAAASAAARDAAWAAWDAASAAARAAAWAAAWAAASAAARATARATASATARDAAWAARATARDAAWAARATAWAARAAAWAARATAWDAAWAARDSQRAKLLSMVEEAMAVHATERARREAP